MKKAKRKYISIILCSLALLLVAVGVAAWIILSEQTGSILPFIVKSNLTTQTAPTASLNENITAIFAGETENFTFDASKATVVYKKDANDAGRKISGTWTFSTLSGVGSTTVKTDTDTSNMTYACPTCKGTGTVSENTCTGCNGAKKLPYPLYYIENAECTATFTPDGIYAYLFEKCTASVKLNLYAVAQLGSTYYTTVDAALATANGGEDSNGSGTVYVLASGNYTNIENARAKVAKTITTSQVKSGVTLALQHTVGATYDLSVTDGAKRHEAHRQGVNGAYADTNATNVKNYLKNNVTIGENVTLTVNGSVVVGGILGNDAQTYSGHTSAEYAQLLMKNKSKIIVNGTLDCLGYVKKETQTTQCELEAVKGTVYAPFVLYDYRGGNYTIGVNKGGGVMPFNQYDVPNLQVKCTIRYNASLKGYSDLYTGAVSVSIVSVPAQHNLTTVNLIGKSGSIINFSTSDSYAVTEYTPRAAMDGAWSSYTTKYGTTSIHLYRGASLGSMSLTVSIVGKTATVATDSVLFSIPWNYDITLSNGDFTIGYKSKFMSGSSLTVSSDATLNINADVIFYPPSITSKDQDTSATFCDYATKDGSKVHFTSSQYPARDAALLNIGGRVTVNSNSTLGGTVHAISPTAYISSASVGTITSKHGAGEVSTSDLIKLYMNTNADAGTFYLEDTVTATLQLVGFDGKNYTKPGGHHSLGHGTTPETFGWIPASFKVSFMANGSEYSSSTVTVALKADGTLDLTSLAVSAPTNPTRQYYDFSHWCTKDGCTAGGTCDKQVVFPLTVYDSTTLYAAWTPTPYTVNFEYVYGFTPEAGTEPSLPEGDFGFTVETDTISMPNTPQSEYIFNGWYTDPNCTKESEISSISGKDLLALNNNNTIYGQWVELQYAFSFGEDKYGDNLAQYNNTYTPEQIATITLPDITDYSTDTEKEFYYTGWLCNGVHYDAGTNLTELLRDGVREYIITPDWIQKAAIKYTANTNVYTDLVTYDSIFWHPVGSTVNLPSLKAHDSDTDASHTYYFASWTLNGEAFDTSNAGAQHTVTGDTTFHITWGNKMVVTINYNGTHQNTLGLTNETVYLAPGHSYTISHDLKAGDNDKNNSLYFVGLGGSDCSVSGNTVTNTTNAATATVTADWGDKIALTINYGSNNNLGLTGNAVKPIVYLLPPTKTQDGRPESYKIPHSLTAGDNDITKISSFVGIGGNNCSISDDYTITPNEGATKADVTVTWANKIVVTVNATVADSGKDNNDTPTLNVVVNGTTKISGLSAAVGAHTWTYYLHSGDTLAITANKNVSGSINATVNGTTVAQPITVTENITVDISLKATGSCIAAGTLITLADGTQKKVEDLTLDDKLLVFNHETGRYEVAGIIFIENDGWDYYNVINLAFSNGTTTRIIYEHALFDITLNKYVYITEANYTEFIGHEFAVQNGNAIDTVTLTDAFVTREYTGCYSLVTTYHLNYFIDGLFSIPGGIDGLFNIFEYGDGLKYDEEKMNADIEEYGLFTYEDFADYIPEEVYEMFPAAYFKVAIGKGMLTFEDILGYIDQFLVKNGII